MNCTCGYKAWPCIGTTDCERHYAQKPCYQPNGSMCANCLYAGNDCSHFDFSKMPVFRRDNDVVIVICKSFRKREKRQDAHYSGYGGF